MDETKAAIQELDGRIQALDAKVEVLGQALDRKIQALDTKFQALDHTVGELKQSVAALEGKVTRLEDKIDRVFNSQSHSFGELHTDMQNLAERLGHRLDLTDNRLSLHSGLLQAGARTFVRFGRWSDASDVTMGKALERLTRVEAHFKAKNQGPANPPAG